MPMEIRNQNFTKTQCLSSPWRESTHKRNRAGFQYTTQMITATKLTPTEPSFLLTAPATLSLTTFRGGGSHRAGGQGVLGERGLCFNSKASFISRQREEAFSKTLAKDQAWASKWVLFLPFHMNQQIVSYQFKQFGRRRFTSHEMIVNPRSWTQRKQKGNYAILLWTVYSGKEDAQQIHMQICISGSGVKHQCPFDSTRSEPLNYD